MARPRFHTLATIPFALGIYGRWGRGVAISFGVASVLVDLDHLADYLWMRYRGHRRHFIAPLHAWELVVAGAALGLVLRRRRRRTFDGVRAEEIVAGLAGGLALHLTQDVLTNHPRHAGVYLLGYRLRHGFDRHRVGWEAHTRFHAWSGKPWYTWI